jgi:isoleucyl-tRNA synthetase
MSKPSDLKSTLNLPRTDFPMKANLPQAEPAQLERWESEGIYARIQAARAGAPTYVLHDGPPYPTGTIHIGTGENKILKDMVVKSKSMAGFRAPYVPGWDCHGLPIETQVEKELGRKGAVSPAEFRTMCREFALRFVDQHRRDFKRLGVFGRWEKPYLTMDPSYEACIADAFLTFIEKGYVYRGLKPVYWCIYDSTALAEAEVEYEDHTSPSIWVRFKLVPDAGNVPEKLRGREVYAIIWTTTPWTIPHSMALAFHAEFDYAAVESRDGAVYLVAKDLAVIVAGACGFEATGILAEYKGKELEAAHLQFQHPFLDRKEPAVLADYVTLDQGTGIVHTAPGHGVEDFQTGQRYGVETYAPLDDQGRYTEGLPAYKGKTVFEANPIVVTLLRERGALLGEAKLTHSYPHCWRCHKPVIFRATEQWFIGMDAIPKGETSGPAAGAKSPRTLRQRALAEIPGVKWTPEWGQERMRSMIADRPDWCVSRQRYWGVPIPVFYCDACGKLFDDVPALRHVIEWFKREGADAWYRHSAEELLPAGTKCACGAAKWRKESDILDVWFDSGSSHLAVLGSAETPWPADMYLEGPDQYRGWFHSSLLVSTGVRDAAPYRHVLTHGWALDEHGRPMSKSLGNVMLPRDICEKWGADMLRLWVAAQDYTADVRMSENVLKQLGEAYRKLRNTFRFALSTLYDFDPARDAVPADRMLELDRWMLDRTAALVRDCRAWYEAFEFHRVYHALHDFAAVELSAFYFDILKDRLYTFAAAGKERRSAQTAVWRIADALVRMLAPILVFTCEEVWKYFPKTAEHSGSVHVAVFPGSEELRTGLDERKAAAWQELLGVRNEVLKALETARNAKLINSALEASVELTADGGLGKILRAYEAWLPALFITSQVKLTPNAPADAVRSEALPGLAIAIHRAEGGKCERCWTYSTHVGESAQFPTVCERCLPVVETLLGGVAAS